jgi:hypothetical protein
VAAMPMQTAHRVDEVGALEPRDVHQPSDEGGI